MNQTTTYEISVSGMDCASCAASIERELARLGIPEAVVNFPLELLVVRLKTPEQLDQVLKTVKYLGFEAHLPGEEAHKASQSVSARELRELIISSLFTLPLIIAHGFDSTRASLNLSMPHLSGWWQAALSAPPTIIGLRHFGKGALGGLRTFRPNMDLLVLMGVSAAWIYSAINLILWGAHSMVFFETAATIVTFMLIGHYIERRAVARTAVSLKELVSLQPRLALRIRKTPLGEIIEEIETHQLIPGDTVLVRQGGRIPVDGTVISGEGRADEAILTGESAPVAKNVDAKVIAGSLLVSGSIKVKVETDGAGSFLSQMITLIKQAQASKPAIQRIGDTVSAFFVPLVLMLSTWVFVYFCWIDPIPAQEAFLRALAVMVVACPCAIGLATPTAISVAIGRASRLGILIKRGALLEEIARVKTLIIDKTGTLTTGELTVTDLVFTDTGLVSPNQESPADKISPAPSEQEICSAITGLEQNSLHPVARSLSRYFHECPPLQFNNIEERIGLGITGIDSSGRHWSIGSSDILNLNSDLTENSEDSKSPGDPSIFVTCNHQVVATITLSEQLQPNAQKAFKRLRRLKLKMFLLSGDVEEKTASVAHQLQIAEYLSKQTPEQKLSKVNELNNRGRTLYIGDGINDTPSLVAASVGVSFQNAADVSASSAGIVLMRHDLELLPKLINLSRQTTKTIKQNLFWAFFYNLIAIPFAITGYLTPPIAAAIMFVSDIFVIGNSLLLRWRRV